MIAQLAEKYNVSKSGIYIIVVLVAAIICAFFFVPDKSFKPTTLRVGSRGQAAPSSPGQAPQPGAPEDIAQQAAAPSPQAAPAPTPTPAPAPAPAATPAPAPAPTAPQAAAVAAVPAPAGFSGRIRRENPFAPIFGQAATSAPSVPGTDAIAPPPDVSYPNLSLPPDVRMSMLPRDFMPIVEPTFILSGIYLASSGKNKAIINDLRVSVGDKVGETDYRVESIDSTNLKQVVLKNSAGRVLSLDLGKLSPSELVSSPTGGPPPPQAPLPALGNP